MHKRLLWLLPATLLLAACPNRPLPPAALVTPLVDLTRAVRGQLRYERSTPPRSDDELIRAAYARNSTLEPAFGGYRLRLLHDDREVVVLVCTRDGKEALLEDASWTPEFVDGKWYEREPHHAANFTLTLPKAAGGVSGPPAPPVPAEVR